jgi:mannitol-1-phosphate 5-dehydrogenase
MKTAIQIGGGNIGRGFIGMLLSQAGYQVVFADVVPALIDRLNADKAYTVHIMDTVMEDVRIENVRAIFSTGEEFVDEVAKADTSILTTAVGVLVLPIIAPKVAEGIRKRKAEGVTAALNIIACENVICATSQLKEHVYKLLSADEQAWCEKYVGFADCTVDRIVPPVRSENPIDVVVEKYSEWIVGKAALKGEMPHIPGMDTADNLMAYIQRKLFTLNTGHCITAYTGILAGHKTIDVAIQDPRIHALVRSAMQQSGDGLIQEFGFHKEAHYKYIDHIIDRFKNPYLQDNVERVGWQPLRKLGAADRLVGPLNTALKYGLPVDKLVLGIGAALRYNNSEDPQSVELQQKIAEKGVKAAFAQVSGVTDEAVLDAVTNAYDEVMTLF